MHAEDLQTALVMQTCGEHVGEANPSRMSPRMRLLLTNRAEQKGATATGLFEGAVLAHYAADRAVALRAVRVGGQFVEQIPEWRMPTREQCRDILANCRRRAQLHASPLLGLRVVADNYSDSVL